MRTVNRMSKATKHKSKRFILGFNKISWLSLPKRKMEIIAKVMEASYPIIKVPKYWDNKVVF